MIIYEDFPEEIVTRGIQRVDPFTKASMVPKRDSGFPREAGHVGQTVSSSGHDVKGTQQCAKRWRICPKFAMATLSKNAPLWHRDFSWVNLLVRFTQGIWGNDP